MHFRTPLLVIASVVLSAANAPLAVAQSVDRILTDLTVSDISVAGGSPKIGTCNRLTVSIHNAGRVAIQETSLLVHVYNDEYQEDYNQDRELTVKSLGPGETRPVRLDEVRISRGGARITATIDNDKRITESVETNNVRSISFPYWSIFTDWPPTIYCYIFSADDITVQEGGTATFTVRRSGRAPRQNQYVTYWTYPGSATGPSGTACSSRVGGPDYEHQQGRLVFSRYDISKTVSVKTCADNAIEGAETFNLILDTSSMPFGSTSPKEKPTATITKR